MAEVLDCDFVENIELGSSWVFKKLGKITFFPTFAFENTCLEVMHSLLRAKILFFFRG